MMNIVFLTTEKTHHWFLINRVHQVHPVRKVFYESTATTGKLTSGRLKRLVHPKKVRLLLRQAAAQVLFQGEQRRQVAYERRMFFGEAPPALDPAIPAERVCSFNESSDVEAVERESPDLVIVFGTSILCGRILEVARVDILNIHRDIVPKYRGGGLPAWVLYYKDFKNLGVTIHQCSAQLDAGDIVGQRFYTLRPDDDMHTLRYKTTLLAAELLCEVITRFKQGTVRYVQQQITNRLFTSRDLTLAKQIVARRNLRRYVRSLT